MSASIFFCYAHEDEDLLNKLKRHLWPLQRQGLIAVWHDRDISAGTEWEQEISQHLNEAKIILLLVSPDFMNSDYCYSVEMKRALERHERKEAIVIPVILRPIYWQGLLGKLQALPTDAKPLVDRSWHTLDEALYGVAEGIRKIVEKFNPQSVSPAEVLPKQASKGESADISHHVLASQPAKPHLSLQPEALSLLRTLTGHTDSVLSVAFSPDGQTLASGSGDETIKPRDVAIKPRDVATGQERRTLPVNTSFSADYVPFLAFHQTIKLWDMATGQERRTLTEYRSYVRSVAFRPDGQILASGSADETIKLWDVATGKERCTLTGHTGSVTSVAFSPDRQTLASGSLDQTIKIWGKK